MQNRVVIQDGGNCYIGPLAQTLMFHCLQDKEGQQPARGEYWTLKDKKWYITTDKALALTFKENEIVEVV